MFAGGGGSGDRENAGANHRPNANAIRLHTPSDFFSRRRLLRRGDQRIDTFRTKELVHAVYRFPASRQPTLNEKRF